MAERKRQNEAGVILLVVVSLLALFVMIGVTYVLVAGQFRRSATMDARTRLLHIDPQMHLDRAMYQLVRDTYNTASVMRGHGLLRDMYGEDLQGGVVAQLTLPSGAAGPLPVRFLPGGASQDQILEVDCIIGRWADLQPAGGDGVFESPLDRPFPRDYFNGCVFTFLDGNLKNSSARVLDYIPVNLLPGVFNAPLMPATPSQVHCRFRLLLPETDWAHSLSPTLGDSFLVNGRPFNGIGFGYQAGAARHLSDEALLPNRALIPQLFKGVRKEVRFNSFISGGADEGYDAVDYQNMALAAVIPQRLNPNKVRFIIPSLHRPALINFWMNQDVDTDDDDIPDTPMAFAPPSIVNQKLGQFILRPLPLEDHHPNFSGGNPHPGLNQPIVYTSAMPQPLGLMLDALKNGPWDVDNDADGIADSIWVDLGSPVQTDETGRRFKPLFAIMCVDMDGRLNVNAHGNGFQLARGGGGVTARPAPIAYDGGGLPRTTLTESFPKGQGYGPAEINLAIDSAVINQNAYYRLLVGYGAIFSGRYGSDQAPGLAGIDVHTPYKFFEYPANYANWAVGTESSFYGLPDLNGELAMAVNSLGQPSYEASIVLGSYGTMATPLGLLRGSTIANNPYEINLLTPQGSDTRFTVAELERVLRGGDADSQMLPERLLQLAPSLAGPRGRRLITTDSFDLPVPSPLVNQDIRRNHAGYSGLQQTSSATAQRDFWRAPTFRITELLRDRLQEGVSNLNGFTSSDPQFQNPLFHEYVDSQVSQLLSPDLLAGMRMNVNRPIGNGRDDNLNRVVDEHTLDDSLTPGFSMPGVNNESFNESLWGAWFFDHNNDGNFSMDRNNALARQQFAQDLFVLTMLLKDHDRQIDANRNGSIDDPLGKGYPNETQLEIAQWVANVIDFRDADSIMTPIELDLNPFNGWHVDGNPLTNESTWGSDGRDNNANGITDGPIEQVIARDHVIVWGCERPELLLSETVAWHDRATEDLDTPNKKLADPESDPVNDHDQRLKPRSAFFIELFNPWGGDDRPPNEFYRATPGVALNAVTPLGHPVWRVIVVRGDRSDPNPANHILDDRHDPDDPDPLRQPRARYIERGIYFVDPTPLRGLPANQQPKLGVEQWYPSSPNGAPAPVLPGQYAVIGSAGMNARPVNGEYRSYLGRTTAHSDGYLDDGSDDPLLPGSGYDNTIAVSEYPTTRRFALVPDPDPTVQQFFVSGNPGFGGPADLALNPTVAVVMDQRLYGGKPAATASLSITDPIDGYPEYSMVNPGPILEEWKLNEADADGAGGHPADGAYVPPLDRPLDDPNHPRAGLRANLVSGLPRGRLDRSGTLRDYARIHLQRLANPLADYHPVLNPFRTIDSSSVDVTAFNGVSNPNPAIADTNIRFRSLQRGDEDPIPIPPYRRELWSHPPANSGGFPGDVVDPALQGTNQRFAYLLRHSLGYLNAKYGPIRPAGVAFTGAPDESNNRGPTFPWLTWLNRPFVSQYDLLLVPRSRSSQLTHDFTLERTQFAATAASGGGQVGSYVKGQQSGGNDYPNAANSRFGHLMNFFETSVDPAGDAALQLHRLLEYTHVPSRFAGTERWFRPDTFQQPLTISQPDHSFHPPFNWVSMFRDPGRVNINTIFDPAVWNAILDGHSGPSFAAIVDARRGYGNSGDQMVGADVMSANSPTFFANAFRPTGSGDLVPVRVATDFARPDVETTIMRSRHIGPALTTGGGLGGGGLGGAGLGGSDLPRQRQPLMTIDDTDNAVNTRRNPYFHYQTLQRLGNLVTTRSNVYAVWITVGFFEVEPNPNGVDDNHPDGYRLGRELRSDSGEIRRHRAFYFIDRSVPVASQPGENHNVDRAILLRRFLE